MVVSTGTLGGLVIELRLTYNHGYYGSIYHGYHTYHNLGDYPDPVHFAVSYEIANLHDDD